MAGAPSLVGELRSHKLHGVAKKKNKILRALIISFFAQLESQLHEGRGSDVSECGSASFSRCPVRF